MKKAYIIITILLGLTLSLSVGKAVLYNALSTSGIFVSNIKQEVDFYKTQNAVLSKELLAASSLTNIAEKAMQAGFTNKGTLMIVKTSEPLAVRP